MSIKDFLDELANSEKPVATPTRRRKFVFLALGVVLSSLCGCLLLVIFAPVDDEYVNNEYMVYGDSAMTICAAVQYQPRFQIGIGFQAGSANPITPLLDRMGTPGLRAPCKRFSWYFGYVYTAVVIPP